MVMRDVYEHVAEPVSRRDQSENESRVQNPPLGVRSAHWQETRIYESVASLSDNRAREARRTRRPRGGRGAPIRTSSALASRQSPRATRAHPHAIRMADGRAWHVGSRRGAGAALSLSRSAHDTSIRDDRMAGTRWAPRCRAGVARPAQLTFLAPAAHTRMATLDTSTSPPLRYRRSVGVSSLSRALWIHLSFLCTLSRTRCRVCRIWRWRRRFRCLHLHRHRLTFLGRRRGGLG